jgi:hypothetical protein
MTSRDDTLDGALRQLRDASNPSADDRARTLTAVRGLGSPPVTPRTEPPVHATGARATSKPWAAWGLALGLVAFTAGFGLGRGSVGGAAPVLAPVPAPSAPAVPGVENVPVIAAAPATVESTPETHPEPRLPLVEPPARARTRPSRPRPRASPSPVLGEPATTTLGLAEALRMLHRAERAIYSNKAAWAISLLDELDERAPATLLHEERIATRVLALCADGQVETAEQLAARARREAPGSIYGALLLRACDTRGEGAPPSIEQSSQSTRP